MISLERRSELHRSERTMSDCLDLYGSCTRYPFGVCLIDKQSLVNAIVSLVHHYTLDPPDPCSC